VHNSKKCKTLTKNLQALAKQVDMQFMHQDKQRPMTQANHAEITCKQC